MGVVTKVIERMILQYNRRMQQGVHEPRRRKRQNNLPKMQQRIESQSNEQIFLYNKLENQESKADSQMVSEIQEISITDERSKPIQLKRRKHRAEREQIRSDKAPEQQQIHNVFTVNGQFNQQQIEIEAQQHKEQTPTLKISHINSDDMKTLITSPVQRGKVMYCSIRRDKSGFNRFTPQYDVYLSQGFKFMMAGKKRAGSTSSNYAISLDKLNPDSLGMDCLGKLRSNFIGSIFNLYDAGLNFEKTKKFQEIRKNLATIEYQTNFFGTNGPRKMLVYAPDPQSTNPFRQTKPDWDLKFQRTEGNLEIRQFKNKPPKWNEQMRAYVLNFNGRVDKPSVKNFILIEDPKEDENLLLFGRVGEDLFNMDVRYPLTPLQAFGIVLSSFDGKLACE